MAFDLEDYKLRTGRLVWEDLDFASFRERPLDADALRCIRYMHDVEFHTVCYLRELLVTPAHADPEVTSFLSFWAFEEYWHGEALGAVLAAHDEIHGNDRVALTRSNLGFKDRIRPVLMMIGGWWAKSDFIAVHMTWGAINEWTTQAGYSLLARNAAHPTLTELVRRIMRQEGRHIDFYATQAARRLEASSRARRLTRTALRHFWSTVGSGVMPRDETAFLSRYLMAGVAGADVVRRIDGRIDRLPGLDGLQLMRRSVDRFAEPPARGTRADERSSKAPLAGALG